ncbi:hypothetical protein PEBR_23958 [Penicillium brasilianum]|uniref:RING-type domain-containing protein n=1 Tax=Penicillium brasilianum TaxID=104259 RepID=A0A1S9RK38_PENBI|nr:hypothetical protein PEBR_23958 [Penicillium brasilianum]
MSFGLFQFQFHIPAIDLDRLGAFTTGTGRRFVRLSEALRSRRSPWAEDVARRGGTSNQTSQPARPRGTPQAGAATGGSTQGASAPGQPATTSGGKPPEAVQDKKLARLKDRLKLVLKKRGANKPLVSDVLYHREWKLTNTALYSRCIACDDPVKPSKLVDAPCGHQYCRPCTREMANLAFKDKSMFPLRCCDQEIPAKQVASALKPRGRRVYIAWAFEAATPPAERCAHTAERRSARSAGIWHMVSGNARVTLTWERSWTWPAVGTGSAVTTAIAWSRGIGGARTSGANVEQSSGTLLIYMCGRIWATCRCQPIEDDFLNDPAWEEQGGLGRAVVVAAMQQADEEIAAEAVHATV